MHGYSSVLAWVELKQQEKNRQKTRKNREKHQKCKKKIQNEDEVQSIARSDATLFLRVGK